jgi:Ca2+-transporting ATPase
MRLVYASTLRTQEAALTGESTPVEKTAEVLSTEVLPLADQSNCLFFGTNVVTGKGRAVVVATGLQTELGRIATLMQQEEEEETPLQKRLTQLGRILLSLSLAIVGVVFVMDCSAAALVAMFLTAVSLAVMTIPELPAIVTVTLALGVMMVKRHALIRRLPAVETLGATTVICTDKTGTLTKNEMTVTRLFIGGRIFAVTGEGYAPVGEIRDQDQVFNNALPVSLQDLLAAAVLCNVATLVKEQNDWRMLGDPTEGALLVVAKGGVAKQALEATAHCLARFRLIRAKRMTVVRRTTVGPWLCQGAPDSYAESLHAVYDSDGHRLADRATQTAGSHGQQSVRS